MRKQLSILTGGNKKRQTGGQRLRNALRHCLQHVVFSGQIGVEGSSIKCTTASMIALALDPNYLFFSSSYG